MSQKPRKETLEAARHGLREMCIFASRPAEERHKALANPRTPSKDFDAHYYDAPDGTYGGYTHNQWHAEAAAKLVEAFSLKPGAKILELGCAKGFVLYELQKLGMDVYGLDASQYAVTHCHPELRGRIKQRVVGPTLAFPDGEFDFVFSKEMLPHLSQFRGLRVAAEMSRVGRHAFLEIQCAETPEAQRLMKAWDITHQVCQSADWWRQRLRSCGYQGHVWFKNLFPAEGK